MVVAIDDDDGQDELFGLVEPVEDFVAGDGDGRLVFLSVQN